MCIVYHKPFGSQKWFELKRTECIQNTLNPDFSTKLSLTYHFEEQQHLKFVLYDIDSNSNSLEDHDFLGCLETTLGQMVSSYVMKQKLYDALHQGSCGEIILTTEELSSCKEEISLQFIGKNLENKHWFGSISPFMEFYKSSESGAFQLVFRTNPVKKTINPVWPSFTMQLRSFCSGDYDRNMKVSIKEYVSNGNHKLIGNFYTTVRKLIEGPNPQNNYTIIHEERKKRKGSSYTDSGQVSLNYVEVREVYSFLDYIKGGTEINAFIAIDFTGK